MKFIPILFSTPMVQAILKGLKTMTRRKIKLYKADEHPLRQTSEWMQENNTCPYGKVGDVLWVRETFVKVITIYGGEAFIYKADDNCYKDTIEDWQGWKPSLFMPKAACRIFLKIIDIRVERLKDITREDAINEGIISWVDKRMKSKPVRYASYCDFDNPKDPATYTSCPINSFETLWQSINGKDSWEGNPWVWVISFERIEKPEKFG